MRKLSVFYEHILQACEHDSGSARVLQGAGNFGC